MNIDPQISRKIPANIDRKAIISYLFLISNPITLLLSINRLRELKYHRFLRPIPGHAAHVA